METFHDVEEGAKGSGMGLNFSRPWWEKKGRKDSAVRIIVITVVAATETVED
jgi:hypothetical protein